MMQKKFLLAQPLETWQIPDQDVTLAASRKGSFDSHVSAEKGPEATTYSILDSNANDNCVRHCSGCHVNLVRV